jgi:hypothetical protein
MDGRGRPVKEDERLSGNPVVRRDDEEPQNGFEGVREAQGARRPSTTMGADSSALHLAAQMASLDGRQEQDEMLLLQQEQELLRRRNGQRRGSRTNLEEVIEYNINSSMQQQQQAAAASSFIYALQQQRQQQMQQQMTAGGLKTFPSSAAPLPPSAYAEWSSISSQLDSQQQDMGSYEPPAEPERPIAARGRRPSIGQLF